MGLRFKYISTSRWLSIRIVFHFLDFSVFPLICKFDKIKLKCYARKPLAEKLQHVQDISEICQAPFGLSQYICHMCSITVLLIVLKMHSRRFFWSSYHTILQIRETYFSMLIRAGTKQVEQSRHHILCRRMWMTDTSLYRLNYSREIYDIHLGMQFWERNIPSLRDRKERGQNVRRYVIWCVSYMLSDNFYFLAPDNYIFLLPIIFISLLPIIIFSCSR